MENKINSSINLSSLLGLNAYSTDESGDCFPNYVNKSLGNEKQYISDEKASISDINNSLLNTLNMIDSTIKLDTDVIGTSLTEVETTYTLDDLLDLGNEDLNPTTLFETSLQDDNMFLSSNITNHILLDTAMSSPLSSSSEESCDLDEILFSDSPVTSNNIFENEVLGDVNMLEQEPVDQENNIFDTIDQSALQDMLNSNGENLSALCSILFQSQGLPSPVAESVEDNESLTFSEPSSPATSESEPESVRYTPYKKKQKSPEQKQRKKAQNRTAATRYRVKKKDELKIMSEEADQLEEKNQNLRGKVDGLKSEIDYLKNLMLDVIKARLTKGASPENLLSVVMSK